METAQKKFRFALRVSGHFLRYSQLRALVRWRLPGDSRMTIVAHRPCKKGLGSTTGRSRDDVAKYSAWTLAELLILGVLGFLFSTTVLAGHAASVFYWVSNDAVYTDRFPSPEAAARVSISRGPSSWRYHHIEEDQTTYCCQWTGRIWWPYYERVEQDGTVSGPYRYHSIVQEIFVCDPTPMIGPQYASDAQGKPKNHTTNPNVVCSTPEVDSDKNPCESNCAGNPINVGNMSKVQLELDYRGPGSFPLSFARR